MCLAVPGKIIKLHIENEDQPAMADVDFGGVLKRICVEWLLPDVSVGDYVLAHVGVALSKINEDEAQQTLKAFSSIAEGLEAEKQNV